MRWGWVAVVAGLACVPATEAESPDPPRVTVEQAGEVTIYTDSLMGVLCYRVGGSLSCVAITAPDIGEGWE